MNLKKHTAAVAEVLQYQIQRGMRLVLGSLRLIPPAIKGAEPSQRTEYFHDFEMALRFDAIEAGVLPVVRALYELGARTKYSCEGHLLEDDTHYPYVVCWLNPELARTLPEIIEKVLLAPLQYHWYIEREDSAISRLNSRESGKPGLFLTLRGAHVPHRLLPVSDAYSPEFIKEWVAADLADIAQRLNALELRRRLPVEQEKGAWLTRGLLGLLLVGPVVLLNINFVFSYWLETLFNVLCQMPLKRVGHWIRKRFVSRTPGAAAQPELEG